MTDWFNVIPPLVVLIGVILWLRSGWEDEP